jgi:hypothetical protein
MENIIFKGLDIPKELDDELFKRDKQITYGMNDKEVVAYHLGIDKAISTLRKLLCDDEHLVVHINQHAPSELTLQELSDIYLDRMLAYTE